MAQTDITGKCPSVHKWSDQRCIRVLGHDGRCWGKAQRGKGTITRTEWYSKNGKFKSHYQYDTKYPSNATTPKEPPHV